MDNVTLKIENGIVVMLDALGVRDYNENSASKYIMHRNKIIRLINDKMPDICSKMEFDLNFDIENGGKFYKNYIKEMEKVEKPKIVIFGDTLIIYWEQANSRLDLFVIYLSYLLTPIIVYGIKNKIMWRGAIGIGKYFIDKTTNMTILGPAVKDAVSWYEDADWIGLIASPQCGYLLELNYSNKSEIPLSHYIKYNVPIKNKSTKSMWVVNWIDDYCSITITDKMSDDKTVLEKKYKTGRNKLLLDFSNINIPKGTESKYKNTLDYFDYWVNHSLLNKNNCNSTEKQ